MTAAHYKGGYHPGNDLGLHYTALPPIVASCPYSDQLLATRKFWSPGANRPSQASASAARFASTRIVERFASVANTLRALRSAEVFHRGLIAALWLSGWPAGSPKSSTGQGSAAGSSSPAKEKCLWPR